MCIPLLSGSCAAPSFSARTACAAPQCRGRNDVSTLNTWAGRPLPSLPQAGAGKGTTDGRRCTSLPSTGGRPCRAYGRWQAMGMAFPPQRLCCPEDEADPSRATDRWWVSGPLRPFLHSVCCFPMKSMAFVPLASRAVREATSIGLCPCDLPSRPALLVVLVARREGEGDRGVGANAPQGSQLSPAISCTSISPCHFMVTAH
eukprot:GGOE01027549.1.p1 GENE.GGOE01027549.1~~GGOE01027549.1.p1  ORF type:complete len:202 (-),score=6.41 GGOE01027549.1:1102-1707(-)